IDVVKKSLQNKNTLFFVAFYKENPVGMTYAHVTDEVCRVDYLLVSSRYRKMGIGRTLINAFIEYCKENKISLCYLWPDGESAEKIYHEAGFRHTETKLAGRAKLLNKESYHVL
ncbi:MAG: GNAT family N-acetyltransferase, partial [Treponema sp.]|nr:GNAT family N-acetyltransferase [Treponema sp.]